MTITEPSLEAVFIELTGSTIAEEGAESMGLMRQVRRSRTRR
jgi:hypothetical protein